MRRGILHKLNDIGAWIIPRGLIWTLVCAIFTDWTLFTLLCFFVTLSGFILMSISALILDIKKRFTSR